MTTLSVIIPVLNDAAFLPRCLAALAAQTLPIDEIIVVDNGSTDDSAAVARDAGARVIREPSPGIPAAAAAGFGGAGSDLLARIDTDTLVPPDWSARLVDAFDTMPDIAAFTGPGIFYDLPPWRARIAQAMYMDAYFSGVAIFVGQKPVFGSNYVIRASVWREVADRVHLSRHVHDDMDLSLVLDGEHVIHFDRSFSVGISPRPVTSPRSLARHFALVVPTLAANWRERGPLRRVLDRRAGRVPVAAR